MNDHDQEHAMTDSTPTGPLDDVGRRMDTLEDAIRESRRLHQDALSAIDAHLAALEAATATPAPPAYRRPRWNAQLAASVCAGLAAAAVIALLFLLNTAR